MSTKYPFLDLLDKKLDDAQSLALETVENAVIAAGAGSGKTQVLATRFAWLVLTDQAKADEILTLTFTNKAAAEMYQRIYETLSFFADAEVSEKLTAHQKTLAQNALSDFANAHIQTLDSYCANIVRQCSNRYGIRPDFTTGSSDGERDVKNRAFKYTLSHATTSGISTFSEAGKLQNFATKKLAYAINKCADITTPKGYFSSMMPVQTEIACSTLNFYFSKKEQADEELPGKMNLAKIISQINSEFAADGEPKKHVDFKLKVDQITSFLSNSLCGLSFTNEDFSTQSETLQKANQLFQTTINSISNILSARKGELRTVSTLLRTIRDEITPTVYSLLAFANQYNPLKNLYNCFDEFLEEVNSAKRMSGNLSFGDVSALALKVLTENPDIREQEIASYKKIMIDEFQDNNGKNRDMLYLLSLLPGTEILPDKSVYSQVIIKDKDGNITEDKRSKDKLFFVGDEKQSIYKFRGADVSVFNELTKNNENMLIPMTYNYRSTPEVIKAFNVLFANSYGIFSDVTDQKEYEAYYNKDALKKGTDLPELTQENVPFHFRFVNTKKIKDENENILNPMDKFIPAEDQIGYFIAKQIYALAGEKKNWSSCAILDKGRTHRSSIIKYLSLFNIPYEVDQVRNIFEEGIINDFYYFLRICVYPSDINAYAAYLSSPLCGLSINSIEIILSHLTDISDQNFVFDPFADCTSKIKEDLYEDQFEKYQKALEFYRENKKLALQQKLTTTLQTLWHHTGYKYETMLNPQVDLCSEHFDLLFELARSCEENNKSVSWFIDELENLKSQWTSDDSDLDAGSVTYPLERTEAVQIMTIHKSKGLQFQHVFLCGCTGVSSKAQSGDIFFDEQTGTSVKPEKGTQNFLFLLQKGLEEKKELAEFRRLIYVGITRAINDVYVMGSWNPESEKAEADKSQFHLFEKLVENVYQRNTSEDVLYYEGTAFDFANLKPATYEETSSHFGILDTSRLRAERIQDVKKIYETAEDIVYTSNAIPRSCPSALETNSSPSEMSEDALQDSLLSENKDAEELRTEDFTAADFGTLVHAYLEAQANGIPPEQFSPETRLLKNLDQKGQTSNKEKILNQCIDFCHQFAQSEYGLLLEEAKAAKRFYRAEWGFKMFWNNTLWTGSIDLIFQKEDGTYIIIDYKSDNQMNTEKYRNQQNCYKVAAAKMLGVPENQIECKLWFMKNNCFKNVL